MLADLFLWGRTLQVILTINFIRLRRGPGSIEVQYCCYSFLPTSRKRPIYPEELPEVPTHGSLLVLMRRVILRSCTARQLLVAIKQTKNRARLLLATPQRRIALKLVFYFNKIRGIQSQLLRPSSGVPSFSLTMYPFRNSTDEHVSLKFVETIKVMIFENNIHWYMCKYFEKNNIRINFSVLLLTLNVPLQIQKFNP